MRKLNSISDDSTFQSTKLYNNFVKNPIGFVDIGAAGGVHSLMRPVASITNCLCFDASQRAAEELQSKGNNIYSNFTVYNNAVAGKNGPADFYLTESEVNSSLLKPKEELVIRYNKQGMKVKEITTVAARTLDSIIGDDSKKYDNPGEIIKLDCQGAEHEILKASPETLAQQCMTIWCEVLFFQVYKNQKTFPDVDKFLCSKGFVLYGLYPKYVSKKLLDRTKYETNERLMWADALYLKDPLEQKNAHTSFTERQIDVLIISALLTGFFDYALEIIAAYKDDAIEQKKLLKLTRLLAQGEKTKIESSARQLIKKYNKYPEHIFLLTKKFIDKNKRNNDVDFLTVP